MRTCSWMAMSGVIHCKGSTEDKSDLRADLITDKQYENFDLTVDWKISPKGNSGIITWQQNNTKLLMKLARNTRLLMI